MQRRVLVAYASRMGSTKEIAEAIGAELTARDLEVDVLPCTADPKPDDYDAVVLGSAVYVRRWDKPARVPQAVRGRLGGPTHLAVPERSLRAGRRDRAT